MEDLPSNSTFWQLDVYWYEDGLEYAETGREILHQQVEKPTLATLKSLLEVNGIATTDTNCQELLKQTSVLMNTKGDYCQLVEVLTL